MFIEFKRILTKKYFESVSLLAGVSLSKQYRYSFLGWAWTLLMPTLQISVYAFIFGSLFKVPHKAQALYIMSGLLPWTFLSNSIMTSCHSLLSRGEAIKRCVMPKTIFPVSDVLRNLHIFLISFSSLYAISLLLYIDFSFTIFLFPIAILPLILFVFSFSVMCSFVSPYIRDLNEFMNVGFMIGFYLTPIIYQIDMMPEKYHIFFELNPIYVLLKPFFDVVYAQTIPSLQTLGSAYGLATVTTIGCYFIYKKVNSRVIFYF